MKKNEAYRQAKKDGATRYQSNKLCPKGHLGERFVASQMCCVCVSEKLYGRKYSETPEEKLVRLSSRREYKRKVAAQKRAASAPLREVEIKRIKQVQSELGLDLPTSREEAKAVGAEFYFNAKPCPKGHVTKRRTKSPGCEECVRIVGRENMRRARELKPEVIKGRKRLAYAKNPEPVKQKSKAYAEANRESVLENKKAYQKRRPEVYRANGAKRRARKNQATPLWVIGDINDQIKALYTEASNRTCSQGLKLAVDHIVPLKNSVVCGLHVPWNLRLTTKLENSKKNNRFDPLQGRGVTIPLEYVASFGSYQFV